MRVSAALLGRLADALIMDGGERAQLFRLAIPELRSLTDRASSMVEAFASVRAFVRRLRAATTQSEALAIAQEHATSLLAADRVEGAVAVANVRSRRGLVAQLSATYSKGHEATELEREQLGTLADLTSLALAGASAG
jgi:hypothetical protein